MSADAKVIPRSALGAMISFGRLFSFGLWDSVWGIVLLGVSSVIAGVRTCSEQISLGVLFTLIAGTAAFNRSFSKLSIGPFYITELCMFVLAVTLGSLLVRKRILLLPTTRTTRRILYLIVAYVAVGTLRLLPELASGASAGAMVTLRNFAVVYYALFAVVGWLAMQRQNAQRCLRSTLWIIVTASTLTSLWTVIAFLSGSPSFVDESTIDVTKVIQGHAVVFAMFSLLMVINFLRYGPLPKNSLLRGAIFVIFLLNVIYVYLSGHRSAVLGCIGAIAVLFLRSRTVLQTRIRWRWVVLAFVIAGLTLYLTAGHLSEFVFKFETLGSPLEEVNAAWRAAFWLNVGSLWLSSPVFGVGFAHDFFNEEPLHLDIADHYDPHNSYLAILARTGVVGLFFVAAATVLFVAMMTKLLRNATAQSTILLASCVLSWFISISIFAAANVTLESPYHAIFYWLLIGTGIFLAEDECPRTSHVDAVC